MLRGLSSLRDQHTPIMPQKPLPTHRDCEEPMPAMPSVRQFGVL